MAQIKELLGKNTWIGVLTALSAGLAVDAIGAGLMVRGVMPEAPGWVYGAYAIGGFIGVRLAVRGKTGTLLRALTVCLLAGIVVCLIGMAVYGGICFGRHGAGVLAGLLCGSLCGGMLGGGNAGGRKGKKKRRGGKR